MNTEHIDYDNPQLHFKVFHVKRNAQRIGAWHHHKELEVLVIQEGKLDLYLETEVVQLKSGDVFVVGPEQLHTDRSYSNLDYYVVQFNISSYLDQSTLPYERFFDNSNFPFRQLSSILQSEQDTKDQIINTVKEIYQEWSQKSEGYEFAVGILIRKILLALIRNSPVKILKDNFNADFIRLKPVFDYIERNLHDKITVEEASSYANISYYYFVKTFKRVVGMSFVNYVNHQRIRNAEKLLLTTDLSIADIGDQIGISNTVHFYRIFRKFHECSPHEYRKKMQSWPE